MKQTSLETWSRLRGPDSGGASVRNTVIRAEDFALHTRDCTQSGRISGRLDRGILEVVSVQEQTGTQRPGFSYTIVC